MVFAESAPPPTPGPQYWIRFGFFSALGIALLAILALVLARLATALTAVATPFVIATVLALLLDPLADRLEARGMKRIAAVGIVFGGLVLALVCVVIILVPILVNQAQQLIQEGPQYLDKIKGVTNDILARHRTIGGYQLPENADTLFAQVSTQASEWARHSVGTVTGVLIGSISTFIETIVALIVTFYMLLDIDRLRARLLYLVPEGWRRPATVFAEDIGEVFSSYLRALVIVCALYGVATTALLYGLAIFHHDLTRYALLVGALAGVLSAVPYLGPFTTALVTFFVAFAAGGPGFGGIAVALTLVLNQVFDNIVTPRLVGGSVGLHPVLSLLALTLGGELAGLVGLLISVPVAASIQVVLFRLYPRLKSPTPPQFLHTQEKHEEEVEATAKEQRHEPNHREQDR